MKFFPIALLIFVICLQYFIATKIDYENPNKGEEQIVNMYKNFIKKQIDKVDVTDEEKEALSLNNNLAETNENNPDVNYNDAETQAEEITNPNIIKIPFNQPSALSFTTKKDVYEIRKKAVANSIFATPDYQPSEEVFGKIVDYKPWVSMKQCQYESTGVSDIDGPSEEGRFIENPALLVAPEYGFYGYSCEELQKRSQREEIPLYMLYDKENNELSIVYKHLVFCNPKNHPAWFTLNGLNARDLGYKYVFVDKAKSTFNFHFVEDYNASQFPYEFLNYIHLGRSCKHELGCNNGSPNQPQINFRYPCVGKDGKFQKNKMIYLKLWKNYPKSVGDKADIIVKIIIQNSWAE